jgi:hypothetical protein
VTVSLPIIPDGIAAEAVVNITFDTSVNPSESGINGRKSYRDQAIRKYTIALGPDDAAEIKSIVLSSRGNRFPLCIRDFDDNYVLTNEPQTWTPTTDGGVIDLVRKFTPSTGASRTGYNNYYQQRILIIDQRNEAFTVHKNGSPAVSGSWTLSDFGVLTIVGLVSGDTVTVSGEYLVPVCFVDDGITTTLHSSATFEVSDIHLQEILEQELSDLTT